MTFGSSDLSLSGDDLRRYRAVLSSLLSPVRPAGQKAWAGSVLRGFADLFGSDRSFLLLPPAPSGGGVRILTSNLDPSCRAELEKFAPPADHGHEPVKDPEHERAMRRLAAAGVRVWNRKRVERLTRVKFTDMDRFYQEMMVAHDVADFATLTLWLPEGPAMISCLAAEPFDDDRLEVLSLLAPAFEAGISTLRALENRGATVGAVIDRLDTAVLLLFADGASHRNPPLRDLLDSQPDPDELAVELDRMAREVIRLHERPSKAHCSPPLDAGTRTLKAGGERLRLHANWLPPGTAGPGPAALVLAKRCSPRLPDARTLGERYGLTARQAQVARLLGLGASNREIADRLEISPHTARHHAQSVLNRVGIHSRKAMGLQFMEDDWAAH